MPSPRFTGFLQLKRPLCSSATVKMVSHALLFPGQGSQYVGITSAHQHRSKTEHIFQTAKQVLGYDLRRLCLQGPEELLNQTIHCQPAVVVSSLVALQQLEDEAPQVLSGCTACAGFSVGEITALIFAGAFSLEQGLKLIKTRAESMHTACQEQPGAMLSLVGLEEAVINGLCEEVNTTLPPGSQVYIANYMFPQGVVISGSCEGVRRVETPAAEMGAVMKRVIVSGAFHSPLMNSAVPKLKRLLQTMDISLPRIPVYSNVIGRPFSSVEEIKHLLADQVTQPVLWEACMRNIVQEKDVKFVEVGPGKQLKAMLRRIDKNLFKSCLSIVA